MALLVNGQRVAGLGSPGVGIKSIERTGGDGTPGTDDIYTITMTDGKTSEFSVHNGADGTNGIDGVTPHVSDNGNWWIGETDTGVVADVATEVDTHNTDTAAHADIRAELATKTNPNILHNWYFANPVNQRGGWVVPSGISYRDGSGNVIGTLSVYTAVSKVNNSSTNDYNQIVLNGTTYYVRKIDCVRGYVGVGYAIDRWYKRNQYSGDYVRVVENGIEVGCGGTASYHPFFQAVEFPERFAGKTLTYSVKVLSVSNEGSFCGAFGYYCNGEQQSYVRFSEPGTYSMKIVLPEDVTDFRVHFVAYRNFSLVMEAAKLEIGDTQTLAHQDENGNWVLNEIPDYNEELLKCCMSTADSSDTYANNKMTPAAIGAVGASNGAIHTSHVDEAKTSGHYLLADDVGLFGAVGLVYDLYVSKQLFDNAHEAIVQTATRVYCGNYPTVTFERSYYYANASENGWTEWTQLATTDYIAYGTEDLTAGTSTLETGKLYFVYE